MTHVQANTLFPARAHTVADNDNVLSAKSAFKHAWKWIVNVDNGQWLLESAGKIHFRKRYDICHRSMPVVDQPKRLLRGWFVLTLCNQCGEIPIDPIGGKLPRDPYDDWSTPWELSSFVVQDPQDRCPSLRLERGICVKCWVGEHPFLDDDGEAEKRKKHSKRVAACARMKPNKVRMH